MTNICLVYSPCQARLNVATIPENIIPISVMKKLKHREVKQFSMVTQLTAKPGFEPQQAGSTICVLYHCRTPCLSRREENQKPWISGVCGGGGGWGSVILLILSFSCVYIPVTVQEGDCLYGVKIQLIFPSVGLDQGTGKPLL